MGLCSRHLKRDEEYELPISSDLSYLESSAPTWRAVAVEEKMRDRPPTMGLGAEEEAWAAAAERGLMSKSWNPYIADPAGGIGWIAIAGTDMGLPDGKANFYPPRPTSALGNLDPRDRDRENGGIW